MLGSYGVAILVVSLLATAAIVGGCVLAFAAHCYLTVLEQTAAGSEDIHWPDEPFHDWIWKGFYLLWLSAFWLAPIWLLTRLLDLPLAGKLLLGGGLFALTFPISLLSSLSSQTRLAVLSGAVLRRLVRSGLALPTFYLLTAVLLAAAASFIRFGLVGWQAFSTSAADAGPIWLGGVLEIWAWLVVLPVTALACAMMLLLHGRLVGWLGGQLRGIALAVQEQDDEDEEELKPAPPQPRPRANVTVPAPAGESAEGELFRLVEEAPPPPILVELPPTRTFPSEPTRRDRAASRPLPLGALPGFLVQRGTWGVLAWLTVGGSILAAIVRVEIIVWPF